MEIGLTAPCDPAAVVTALDAALPPGLDVLDAVEVRTSDFAHRLEASEWYFEMPGVDPAALQAARDALWAAESVEVERRTKSGLRRFDAREPLVRADVDPAERDGCAILTVVVRHVTLSVRPDDVLAALRQVADFEPPGPPRVTRLAQGPLDPVTHTVGDPLASDRGN